jgi:hypothetical protein
MCRLCCNCRCRRRLLAGLGEMLLKQAHAGAHACQLCLQATQALLSLRVLRVLHKQV